MDWLEFINQEWMLVSLLLILLTVFIWVEGQRSGGSMSLHEVTRLVNDEQAIVLDVRDSKEYNAGHIVDSVNIPYAKLADRSSELEKHKALTIVVVDKMGQHAGAAAKSLKEKGFTVTRMQGGITEWKGQNLPLVKA